MDIYMYHYYTDLLYTGKGMSYIPGAASLAATHTGRIKNICLSTLRDSEQTSDPQSCILSFEKDTVSFDKSMKEQVKVLLIE